MPPEHEYLEYVDSSASEISPVRHITRRDIGATIERMAQREWCEHLNASTKTECGNTPVKKRTSSISKSTAPNMVMLRIDCIIPTGQVGSSA